MDLGAFQLVSAEYLGSDVVEPPPWLNYFKVLSNYLIMVNLSNVIFVLFKEMDICLIELTHTVVVLCLIKPLCSLLIHFIHLGLILLL